MTAGNHKKDNKTKIMMSKKGKKRVRLGEKMVGEGEPVYIVAEGGVTHFGDLKLAKKQIDAAVEAGCDAIKFQKRDVAAIPDEYWRKRLEYKEFSEREMLELRNYCQKKNILFFVTPHDNKSLDFVDRILDTPVIKVGSGESLDFEFLKNVGSKRKPVIISLGLHLSDDEIKKSVKALEKGGAKDIILLHCSTVYPTPPEIANLAVITRLKKLFSYPLGYSDHTVGWHIPLAAVSLGASLIEKHISFDKTDERSLDCAVSCLPDELKLMVGQIREIEEALKFSPIARKKALMKAREWTGKLH